MLLSEKDSCSHLDVFEEESIKLGKALVEEIDPLVLYKSNIDVSAMIDGNTFHFDGTSGIIRNVTERDAEFSIQNHILNRNVNLASRRNGNLASSHIIDYSAFLANPPMKTSTIIPDLEIISSATTLISISGKEMPPKDHRHHRHWITDNESDFRKMVISPSTDRTSVILPFKPLRSSTISTVPGQIVFPNRKNFDKTHIGIKSVLDETGRSTEEESTMSDSDATSIKSVAEPINNSGNRSISPITFITVGDREILEEQKSQKEASPAHLMPYIAVGERISELQETVSSDSEKEAMVIEKQANARSTSSYRSAEVAQETHFRNPFQSGFNSGAEMILPDLTTSEDKIAPSEIFFSPEDDLATSEPDYLESFDSSLSNINTLFAESADEREKNEFRTPISTQLPEHTRFTQSQQLSSNPIGLNAMDDEVDISEALYIQRQNLISEFDYFKTDRNVVQLKYVRNNWTTVNLQFQDFIFILYYI